MLNILVADDDEKCRDSMQKVFEREGYQVESAADVDSALEAMRVHRFDRVVCDYRMPGKTGVDLLIELKKNQSNVPVMIVSACADAATEQRMRELGAMDLMRKPIRRRELVDRAAKLAGG